MVGPPGGPRIEFMDQSQVYKCLCRKLDCAIALPLAILCLGGCGDGSSHRQGAASTQGPLVAKVEHQCGIVYLPPSVKGEILGFTCGETASGAHFGATFTRRPRCRQFMILVDTGHNRFQQCLAAEPSSPRGAVFCRNNLLIFAARTSPGTQSATVLLSTGQKAASRILVLSPTDREQWGGFFFDALASRIPVRAVLIEHDQSGHPLGHLSLTPAPGCPSVGRAR